MIPIELVVFVDIDDTLVRSFGSKRIPMTSVIDHVKRLHESGVKLYGWSSGGGEYARSSAREVGIESCFVTFVPKPNVILDDQAPSEWRRTVHLHPTEAISTSVDDLLAKVESTRV